MSSKTLDDFLERVRQSAGDGTLVRLNLGASIQPDGIRNVFIRPGVRDWNTRWASGKFRKEANSYVSKSRL